MPQHHLFILMGLSDTDKRFFKWLTKDWIRKYGIIPHIMAVGWYDRSSNFTQKLLQLVKYIEPYYRDKLNVISFLGCSAGASAAINIWRYFVQKGVRDRGGIIKGATNILVPMIEHTLSIGTALVFMQKRFINHLKLCEKKN